MDGPPFVLFGLASDGVYISPLCYHRGGGLLHHPSTLTSFLAVYFCCTVLGVTSTRRYLASCPAKPGLSSPTTFAHPGIGQTTGYYYTRESNPTRTELEEIVNTLEHAYDTVATSSGMAALSIVLELFGEGDATCSKQKG